MKISKDKLSLAGEYAVASEICRRDIYAQLTLGKHKRTDILVDNEKNVLRIQVKSKQGGKWPWLQFDEEEDNLIWVFVDFEKSENEKPDFYVLTNKEFGKLWKDETKRQNNEIPKINQDMIEQYKDKWSKLKEVL